MAHSKNNKKLKLCSHQKIARAVTSEIPQPCANTMLFARWQPFQWQFLTLICQ